MVQSVGVVGAGQMGAGIAQVAAQAGYSVVLVDLKPEFVAKGVASIEKSLAKLAEKGILPAEASKAARARITTGTDNKLLAGVTSSFIISLGTLLSLRAPTVKKAQERIGYVMLPIFFLPAVAPSLINGAASPSPTQVVLMAGVLPLVIVGGSIAFNVLVFTTFRRDRLVGRS